MYFKLVSVLALLIVLISSASSASNCACPRQSAPVCGSDGTVYANRCLLDCNGSILNTNITVVKNGPCDAQETTQCVCTKNMAPVCGTDGVTYANVCLLRCARKKNPSLEVKSQGDCSLKRHKRMLYEGRYKMHKENPCSIFTF